MPEAIQVQPPIADGTVVIGMDPPSGRNCGWSVCRLTAGKLELLEKETQILSDGDIGLEEVYGHLEGYIVKYGPVALSVERSVGGGLAFVRGRLNEAVGVCKLCCLRHKVAVSEVSPAHLKMIIAGHGRAKKKHIKANVVAFFNLKKAGPEHECDAAAFAVNYFVDRGWSGYKVNFPYTA